MAPPTTAHDSPNGHAPFVPSVPCVLFEDDHLLVVRKPAGLNTHAPSPYAGEGLYEWLRHREPRWAKLAIIHRLDKETSGLLLFSKTTLANKSLTDQFTRHAVRKHYLLRTDRPVPGRPWTVRNCLVRAGAKYVSRPLHASGDIAETLFRPLGPDPSGHGWLVQAEPLTGRTHQIRVHAAESTIPILGDTLYGGTPAARVYLHAASLTLQHPATGGELQFEAKPGFEAAPSLALRDALLDSDLTNACRLLHGAADGHSGWYVERLGDYLLSQSATPLRPDQITQLTGLLGTLHLRGAYHKLLQRSVRGAAPDDTSPQRVAGEAAPDRFTIRENGLAYELSFGEGYSVGLFLDQRDNRRRLLTRHIAAGWDFEPREVLNTFAYTCGFSVAAAKGGARTTSLDLSKKYLEWGRRNFALNQLDPAAHDFIYGDTFDWLRRLARKSRRFDTIILDPPTFSQSKDSGVFRAEKDYGKLVQAALGVLEPGGVLLASTNAADWPPEAFIAQIEAATRTAGRKIQQRHYVPQPPDFPVTRDEPAYLKTLWFRVT